MNKRLLLISILACTALTATGCVRTKMYIAEKERVDQDIPGVPADAASKKTRQVIVVEVVDKDKVTKAVQTTDAEMRTKTSKPLEEKTQAQPVEAADNNQLPTSAEDPAHKAAGEKVSVGDQSYVVQKDDTLQKIAKKFYGSYNEWMPIYDANRDVIKNPNMLKSGVTLKIPAAGMPVVSEADPSQPTASEAK